MNTFNDEISKRACRNLITHVKVCPVDIYPEDLGFIHCLTFLMLEVMPLISRIKITDLE